MGDKLTAANEEDFLQGAIILSDEALAIQAQGGLAAVSYTHLFGKKLLYRVRAFS